MRKFISAGSALALSLLWSGLVWSSSLAAAEFTLTSSDFKAGDTLANAQVANSFGCAGGNVSPALSWVNAPKDARSFVLMVYDPDAPTGSGFWHWVVLNIPATVTSLPRGIAADDKTRLPAGAIQSRTDVGVPGFLGACPPQGDKPHRYQFTLYALDVASLPLTADTTPAVVGFNVHFHTLAKAQLQAIYSR